MKDEMKVNEINSRCIECGMDIMGMGDISKLTESHKKRYHCPIVLVYHNGENSWIHPTKKRWPNCNSNIIELVINDKLQVELCEKYPSESTIEKIIFKDKESYNNFHGIRYRVYSAKGDWVGVKKNEPRK